MFKRNDIKVFEAKYGPFLLLWVGMIVALDLIHPPHHVHWLFHGRELFVGAGTLVIMNVVRRGLERSGLMARDEFDLRVMRYFLFFATVLLVLVVFDMITATHHAPWRTRGQILIALAFALPALEIAVRWYRKARRTHKGAAA